MTTIALPFTGRWTDRRASARVAILVCCGFVCVLYALWRHTVPPGTGPSDVQADTMCLISRIGLGGLCQ